ncbi:MAG: Lrp/AsnC family transcriptional regulator [Nitrososphaerales archaeon]
MLNKSGFEVDDIDLKIIQVLVKNARADFKDIAEIVGVSDRTVARRIERLEKNKVIRGYHVDLDQEALMQQGINLPECDEYVKLSRLEWEELWNALGKIMGSGLGILLFHAGKAVGSEIGSKLLKRYIEPSTALNMLPTMLVGRGCKECRLIDLNQDKGLGKLEVVKQGITIQKNTGIFLEWLRGLISGALETILGKKIDVVEDSSVADRITYRFSQGGDIKT